MGLAGGIKGATSGGRTKPHPEHQRGAGVPTSGQIRFKTTQAIGHWRHDGTMNGDLTVIRRVIIHTGMPTSKPKVW